jgi:hypothetical protein
VDEEVVDLFYEIFGATIIVVPNPREKVVDGFFQEVFEVCSKRSITGDSRRLMSTKTFVN